MPGPRVLIASYSGVLGGAERVLLDCATRLTRPVTVACPEGPLAAALRAAGSRTRRSGHARCSSAPAHVAHVLGLARDLRRSTAGVRRRLGRAGGARGARSRAARGSPSTTTCSTARCAPQSAPRRGAPTASPRPRTRSPRQFGGDAAVLHPGVDLARFTPRPLPDGPPHALVLGALVGWKRPELALEIAARMPELRAHARRARRCPATTAALESALREQARATSRPRSRSPVDDVPGALADAHVLLHCADAEPYGMALVEALAAGRPVVAPAAAGPLEIVTDGAGRLYPPGDAAGRGRRPQQPSSPTPAAPASGPRAAPRPHFDVDASAARLEAPAARERSRPSSSCTSRERSSRALLDVPASRRRG